MEENNLSSNSVELTSQQYKQISHYEKNSHCFSHEILDYSFQECLIKVNQFLKLVKDKTTDNNFSLQWLSYWNIKIKIIEKELLKFNQKPLKRSYNFSEKMNYLSESIKIYKNNVNYEKCSCCGEQLKLFEDKCYMDHKLLVVWFTCECKDKLTLDHLYPYD